MAQGSRPDVLITITGPKPPYSHDQLLKALRATYKRFVALRKGGATPEAALATIEAEVTAAAASDPAAKVILDNRLQARVIGAVQDNEAAFINMRKEPWDWVMRCELDYIAVIKHLPVLPFAKH